MNVLKKVKEQYHITDKTPVGRIDWAINDFIANHKLTIEEKNTLVMASSKEVAEA